VTDFASYFIPGHSLPLQFVHESRTRVAMCEGGNTIWTLHFKRQKDYRAPLADWEYEHLRRSTEVAFSEAQAVKWVRRHEPRPKDTHRADHR
jgi:hypothetical protein